MPKIIAEFGKELLNFELDDEKFPFVLESFAHTYGNQYGWTETVLRPDPSRKAGELIEIPNPETMFAFWLRVLKTWSVEVVLESAQLEIDKQKEREKAAIVFEI